MHPIILSLYNLAVGGGKISCMNHHTLKSIYERRNARTAAGGNSIATDFKYHVFAPMGRFQLDLFNLPSFSTVFPSNSCCFCPVGLSLL